MPGVSLVLCSFCPMQYSEAVIAGDFVDYVGCFTLWCTNFVRSAWLGKCALL